MSFACCLIGADSLLIECGNRLLEAGHRVSGVAAGSPKVRAWAQDKGLPCWDVEDDILGHLQSADFDYLFAITHLRLLPASVLETPRRAAINFHDGPLPKYAGLNAPAWALLNGEATYGITWHLMTPGVDEGDILEQRTFELTPRETSLSLNTRNFQAALDSFQDLIAKLDGGHWERVPQETSQRSVFRRHMRPERAAILNFGHPADEQDALVRALDFGTYHNPLYLPKLRLGDEWFAVRTTEPETDSTALSPGEVSKSDDGLLLGCTTGTLRVLAASRLSGTPVSFDELPDALTTSAPDTELLRAVEAHERQLVRAESFWQRRLSALEPAELVAARGAGAGGEWVSEEVPCPASLATMTGSRFAASIAALGLYLGRTSGKRSFALAFAGRAQQRLSDELGALVAARVPLSFTWDQDSTVKELLANVEQELTTLESKGSYWSDLIGRVPDLVGRDDLARGNVAPVMATSLDEASTYDPSRAGATLQLVATDDGLRLYYRQNTFEGLEPSVGQQLATLLGNMANAPTARCGDVPLVAEEQARQLLRHGNASQVPRPFAQQCVHWLFDQQVAATPNRIALQSTTGELSYAELQHRARTVARELTARGITPRQLVGVMVPHSTDAVVAALGTMMAGCAYVPMDPTYPSERIRYMARDSGVVAILTTAEHVELAEDGIQCVLMADIASSQEEAAPDTAVSPTDLAYVIYTSGSTGQPKGVMVEHRNVCGFFDAMDRRIPRDEHSAWLSVTSLSFDISVLELFWSLCRGVRVVLYTPSPKAAAGSVATTLTPSSNVDFSLFLWGADDGVATGKYDLMLEAGRFGDANGFTAIWTPERHFHAFGGPYPNPAVTSAALAVATSRIQIRAGSCVVPLHHPVRVAEEWAVVDNLSGGRVGISFASGWQPDDFLLAPDNYRSNKRVMMDALAQVRALWRGESVSFANGMGKDVAIVTQPRPVQDELPYWLTAAGNPETFHMAGEAGANLLTHLLGQSIDQLADKIAIYRQARAAAGHDPKTGIVSLMLHTHVASNTELVKQRVREPMKEYLRTSVNLIKGFAWAFPAFKRPSNDNAEELDIAGLSEEDLDAILEFAFERYFTDSGLFGTPKQCLQTVERVRQIGVDDIACLIDFGVPNDLVKDGLIHLAELVRLVESQQTRTAASATELSFHETVDRYGITHFQCTPSLMRALLVDELDRQAVERIPHLMLGGEALPLDMARQLADRRSGTLTNMYGPTETTIWSTTHRVEAAPTSVPIGKPIANTRVYVLDSQRQLVPVGVPGELYIAGTGVVRGYHEQPELTQERFPPDPFTKDGSRMYRTGDLARWQNDGTLEFLGRTDHQVKIRGHRIELGEIEAQLLAQDDVVRAAVVAREDTPGDQRLVAYYVGSAEEDHLRKRSRSVLPASMVPAVFCRLPQLPQTPNGKIDRKALPAPSTTTPRRRVEPSSDVESQLAELWCRHLGLERVSVTDNFFDLGGHSLLVVQLHQAIRRSLPSLTISMTDLYRFPTVRSLVQHLSSTDEQLGRKRGQARAEKRRARRLRQA